MYNVYAGGDKMKFDLIRLKNKVLPYIEVDEHYSFSEEELKNSGILELNDIHITGNISLDAFDELEVSLNLMGKMILPCSVTLKPVECKINVQIEQNVNDFIEETGENSIISENTLDILPIIWENILMEIPMKVVSKDVSDMTKSGNGWKVIDHYEQDEETNPELEKLKDLL